MKDIKYDELTETQQQLILSAEEAVSTAYAPYSNFKVGAAILTVSGETVTGSNVEDVAGSSICAERAALVRANAMGYRDFTAIAIIASPQSDDQSQTASPCGACRQTLHEFSSNSGKDIEIVLASLDHSKVLLTTVSELLPLPFSP